MLMLVMGQPHVRDAAQAFDGLQPSANPFQPLEGEIAGRSRKLQIAYEMGVVATIAGRAAAEMEERAAAVEVDEQPTTVEVDSGEDDE